MPDDVKDVFGYALDLAQRGESHPDTKTWKGAGPGVREVAGSHDGNAYRCVYTVRFEEAVYVVHVWQKKSPKGRKTARTDVKLISARLKAARNDYEERYGKKVKEK